MATGLTDPQQAADLERALRSMEPPVCPQGLVPALAGALAASVDPQRGLSHLLRYLACLGDAGAFWDACRARPEFLRRLAAVFAASRFLSGVLWRDPQLALWLCEEALVAPPPAPDALARELEASAPRTGGRRRFRAGSGEEQGRRAGRSEGQTGGEQALEGHAGEEHGGERRGRRAVAGPRSREQAARAGRTEGRRSKAGRAESRRARSTRPPCCCASRTGICCAWGRAT